MVRPVATAIARRLACPPDGIVFCGPGGSLPRGTRSRLSVGNYRRVYKKTAARAVLEGLDLHGPHDLRHTYATWLEDGGIPGRVIDELMGHVAGRRGEREGSLIGTHYRHMTAEMQARVAAIIEQQLTPALVNMPRYARRTTSGVRRRSERRATSLLTCDDGGWSRGD